MSVLHLAALALVSLPAPLAEDPFQDRPFGAACEKARVEKKVVMIDFFTTWCGPCKRLDATTWKDASVRAWIAENAIALKLDAERETALAARYAVEAYPTILFVKPDGAELDRIVGYEDAATFLESAKRVLSGKTGLQIVEEKVASRPMDVDLRYERGEQRARKGMHAEALEDLIWCFDEIPARAPAMVGVRLSFLLNDIAQLGSKHPPALDALRKRARAAKDALEGTGPVPPGAAHEYSAIQRALGEPVDLLPMFDAFAARPDRVDARRQLGEMLLPKLASAKRWADAAAALGDAKAVVAKEIASAKAMLKESVADEKDEAKPEGVAARYVGRRLGLVFEVMLGAGKDAEAAGLASTALELSPSEETRKGLVERARNVGEDAGARLSAAAAALPTESRARVAKLVEALARPASAPTDR